MANTIKEYLVPFTVDGFFRVRATSDADLKSKMDGMMIGDLMNTSEDIQLTARPDKASIVATVKEKKNKINIKYVDVAKKDEL